MTSSLVGSEMCIRDSGKTSQHEVKQALTNESEDEACAKERPTPQPSNAPVSYTHLTLPTICSV
eukprot:9733866-Prorocentrum_lima.AAC.1